MSFTHHYQQQMAVVVSWWCLSSRSVDWCILVLSNNDSVLSGKEECSVSVHPVPGDSVRPDHQWPEPGGTVPYPEEPPGHLQLPAVRGKLPVLLPSSCFSWLIISSLFPGYNFWLLEVSTSIVAFRAKQRTLRDIFSCQPFYLINGVGRDSVRFHYQVQPFPVFIVFSSPDSGIQCWFPSPDSGVQC